MATESDRNAAEAGAEGGRLAENIAKMEELTRRLTAAMGQARTIDPALHGPAADVYMKAAAAYVAQMMREPGRVIETQVNWWGRTLKTYAEAQAALAKGAFRAPEDSGAKDRRFANPLWDSHPFFNLLKQQYQANAEAVMASVRGLEGLDEADARRLDYFTRQIVDMFAPTNFLATNPDALEKAVATEGESLVRGLENLVRDIEANNGALAVTLADREAFTVGGNIATSPGSVVYRNRLIELIQYAPATPEVHATPLVIFPPWINKFYILDLKAQNSLVKWLVDQGFTLFVVSWVNPNESYRDTGLDDYIRDGFIRALAEVRRATGAAQVNAVGYCIAGTTLSLTLAHLSRAGDQSVGSATLLTTLTDFSDPGEVGVFLNDDFVEGLERQTAQDGILSKLFMSRTFSFLRSNDLIWQPAIKSYMMGEAPPAFDLLYWNGDGTNLPAKMAMEYLRGLCQRDGFARGEFPVFGRPVALRDVTVPLCAVACETDHIAHWRGSFNGVKQMGSAEKTFILSESGHIAGIVNPPGKDKYGHYAGGGPVAGAPEDWLKAAEFHRGSWWPRWGAWLAERSGPKVPAREPEGALAAAPGTYVTG
jgi:polyhydroxyalkanoate synthase subunit PhaC